MHTLSLLIQWALVLAFLGAAAVLGIYFVWIALIIVWQTLVYAPVVLIGHLVPEVREAYEQWLAGLVADWETASSERRLRRRLRLMFVRAHLEVRGQTR